MRRFLMTAIVFLLCLVPLRADLTLTQAMTVEGGPAAAMMAGKQPMTVVVRIKGKKARTDMDAMETKLSTLVDLSTRETTLLNHQDKTAHLTNVPAAAAPADQLPAGLNIDVAFQPTGQTRAIDGVECAEHTFKMSVSMADVSGQTPKEGQPQLPKEALEMMKDMRMVVDGATWIAKSAPGAEEYMAFQKAAAEANIAAGLGGIFAGRQSPGMEKLGAALSGIPGLAYLTEMTMTIEGTGPMVDMMKAQISGMKVVQKTTAVSTEPLDDTLFTVPADYVKK